MGDCAEGTCGGVGVGLGHAVGGRGLEIRWSGEDGGLLREDTLFIVNWDGDVNVFGG